MATAAQLLDGEAFNQLVLEKDLRTWEQAGYIYAGYHGPSGWELFRTYGPKFMWYYQARRVVTQSNAGGGALSLRFSVASGMTFRLEAMYVQGPVTNTTLVVYRRDEDGAQVTLWASIAAGASRDVNLGSMGVAATSNGNLGASNYATLGPGEYVIASAGAAAQTETLTIGVSGFLPITAASDGSDITWSTAGSAGTPSLAASTISTANTMQLVLMP